MIWVLLARWLRAAHAFISWELFIVEDKIPAAIDPNELCPACGHNEGELLCVPGLNHAVVIRHTCKVCKARWHAPTVMVQKDAGVLHPADGFNAV